MKINFFGLAGFFLVVEGVMSIVASQDQQPVSQAGRIIRIGIGGGLIYYDYHLADTVEKVEKVIEKVGEYVGR